LAAGNDGRGGAVLVFDDEQLTRRGAGDRSSSGRWERGFCRLMQSHGGEIVEFQLQLQFAAQALGRWLRLSRRFAGRPLDAPVELAGEGAVEAVDHLRRGPQQLCLKRGVGIEHDFFVVESLVEWIGGRGGRRILGRLIVLGQKFRFVEGIEAREVMFDRVDRRVHLDVEHRTIQTARGNGNRRGGVVVSFHGAAPGGPCVFYRFPVELTELDHAATC
jgi:hypothetical protein